MRYCHNCPNLRSQQRDDSNGRNPDGETTSTGTSPRGRERSSSRARHRSASRHDQQEGNPSPILRKSAHVTFAPPPPTRNLPPLLRECYRQDGGGKQQPRRITPTDRDTTEIDEDLDKLPTRSQQFRTLEEVRQRLLPDPMNLRRGTEGPSRCLFAWRLAAAMRQVYAVTSLMEQEALTRRALTLDSLWGLFEVQKAIEERSAPRAHVCAESHTSPPHRPAGPHPERECPEAHAESIVRTFEKSCRGDHDLKRERWSEFPSLFKECFSVAAQFSTAGFPTLEGNPPWPHLAVPPQHHFHTPAYCYRISCYSTAHSMAKKRLKRQGSVLGRKSGRQSASNRREVQREPPQAWRGIYGQ